MIKSFTNGQFAKQCGFDRGELEARGSTICNVQTDSDVELRDRVQALATQLGEPVATRTGGKLVKTLRPTTEDHANRPSLSRAYGLGEFPLHSDTAHWLTPCRYVVLACLTTGGGNRPTVLLDTRRLRLTSAQVALLYSAPIRITNGRKSFFSTILCSDGKYIRYDPGCMTPVMSDGVHAMEVFAKTLWPEFLQEVQWQPGKVAILDNWRVLHGRGTATCHDFERTLIRICIR
jgi:hypothetical protein